MKRTPLRSVSKKNVTRVGKLGIVRLRGKDLLALKHRCHERDGYQCVKCSAIVACFCEYTFGHRNIDDFSWMGFLVKEAEMAHIHAKRNGGDTLDNVRTLCPNCHRKEHNAGGKPCPPKR